MCHAVLRVRAGSVEAGCVEGGLEDAGGGWVLVVDRSVVERGRREKTSS